MSEQTPNSSKDLNGVEPSMEDILASIRKIISDDEPVAMESPEDVPTADLVETAAAPGLSDMMRGIHSDSNDLTSDAVLDAAVIQPEPFHDEGDSVDLNIDDVLAGLDDDPLLSDANETSFRGDTLSASNVDADADVLSFDAHQTTLGDFDSDEIIPDADEDILSFLDADIPLTDAEPIETTHAMPSQTAAIAGLGLSKVAADDDTEMDSLLDDILMSPLEIEEASAGSEDTYGEDIIETDFTADTTSAEVSDLDLVKSLMADLSDDPSGLEAEEDLDALLAIPDAEDDILGDILDMTVEDELQAHPDDFEGPDDFEVPDDLEVDEHLSLDAVLDAEQENIAENLDFDEELLTHDTSVEDLPSLSEIAAAAEADAVAVETVQAPVAATAGLAAAVGGAALGATALRETETEAEAEAETETETDADAAETYSEQTREPISTPEETSMPVQAVKTDAILDEVTETAAAGAFAELNQVVEDKAVFNESGPRIGDLVQDALRPMLKEWLDANLKGIVERAVAKEVKRISSGK